VNSSSYALESPWHLHTGKLGKLPVKNNDCLCRLRTGLAVFSRVSRSEDVDMLLMTDTPTSRCNHLSSLSVCFTLAQSLNLKRIDVIDYKRLDCQLKYYKYGLISHRVTSMINARWSTIRQVSHEQLLRQTDRETFHNKHPPFVLPRAALKHDQAVFCVEVSFVLIRFVCTAYKCGALDRSDWSDGIILNPEGDAS
jgi:hypothetical protein